MWLWKIIKHYIECKSILYAGNLNFALEFGYTGVNFLSFRVYNCQCVLIWTYPLLYSFSHIKSNY
jgi:hypothetical protein